MIPLDRYFAGERHPARFTVALTFDDGYASTLELALPRLEAAGLPATFFVTTAAADDSEMLWPDLVDLARFADGKPLDVGGERFVRNRAGEYVSVTNAVPLKTRCRHSSWAFVSEVCAALAPRIDAATRLRFVGRWRLLDVAELRRLAASPVATLGTHGRRHLSLTCLSRDEARDELVSSRRWLEATLDRPVDAVAFPHGSWNDEILDLARESGYR